MRRSPWAAVVTLSVLAALGAREPRPVRASAPSCPEWLRQAAAAPLSEAQRGAPAVVLYDEQSVTVSPSGEVRMRRLYAAKVFTVEGRDAASLRELYLTDSEKVREMRGWVLRPSGEVRELGKDDIVDVALVSNDIYNEVRARRIGLGPNPEAGVVFGAEVTSESRSIFSQLEWPLQDEWPAVRIVRSLALPPGWRATSITFNHPAIEPTVAGGSWTWTVRDLPRIADEPDSPPWTSLAPRLAVTFEGATDAADRPAFSDWASVSRWLASMVDPASAPDARVQAKARELTTHARSDLEALRALAAFVQRTQYVSIQIGAGRGGGYRPHRAADVLAKGQGDCKDKASLLKAMLEALGKKAFLVSVFAGDPTYVRDTWPSPHQFNHVIVGIPTLDSASPGATVEAPGIGTLLLFDPTDPFTPLGELPLTDQGSLALVVSSAGGPLVRLPETGPEANGSKRTIEGQIDETGRLTAMLRDRFTGGRAAAAREQYRGLAPDAYVREMKDRMARSIPRSELAAVEAEDDELSFRFKASVTAPAYAQVVQGRLLLVKCPTPLADFLPSLASSTRRTPVALAPSHRAERMVLAPAAGVSIDELPAHLEGEGPYGSYRLSARHEGDKVIVEREITTRRSVVPVAEYQAVRAFVERARAVDAATVVFKRGQ